MKFVLRLIFTIALLGVLVAGWFYLFSHSHAVSAERQNMTLNMLKDLRQIDSDWNNDVLKSQTEINKSYDPLTRPLKQIADTLTQVQNDVSLFNDPALVDAVKEIRSTIDGKSLLIDSFKAQNSLLKNSLRYIPTAHQDIQERMRTAREQGMNASEQAMQDLPSLLSQVEKSMATPEGATPETKAAAEQNVRAALGKLRQQIMSAKAAGNATRNASQSARLSDQINRLVNDALRYYSLPDQEGGLSLRSGTAALREETANFSDAAREPIDNLRAHLDAILRLRTSQTQILQKISEVPVGAKIEQLATQLVARFDRELAEQGAYNRFLLIYSAGVLILVFSGVALITYRGSTERRRLSALVEDQTRQLKDNEVHLLHAQKMNTMGEMAAGIAHEVNTPLAAVKSGLQSTSELLGSVAEYINVSGDLLDDMSRPALSDASMQQARDDRLKTQLQNAHHLKEELKSYDALGMARELMSSGLRSVEHVHNVILNMLNFSRLDRSRVAPVKIEEGIESTLAMAGHFLRQVKLTKHYGNTPLIQCDMAQINQVLLNLLRNAAQAMSAGQIGEITIETHAAVRPEDGLSIVIRDNGSGIPDNILHKIWDPFFTTKKEGAGTGLGLSTSKKIITSHGGTIDAVSTPGEGTTFTINLPATPPVEFYKAQAST